MYIIIEGKAAMAVNPGEFNRSASARYALLPDEEKARLMSSVEHYQSKDIVRRGGTIFKRIQSLVRYNGFFIINN